MILCLAAVIIQGATSPNVSDFFPTAVGTIWTYEESTNLKSTYRDQVIEPVIVEGVPMITIVTTIPAQPPPSKVGEQKLGMTHYRIVGDTVFAAAFETKMVLANPHPVLKIQSGSVTWEYKGVTPLSNVLLPMEFKATSSWKPKQALFGEERECIQVVMNATIKEAGGFVTTTVHQVSTYAKGLGMVEMVETSMYNRQQSSRSVKLLKFESPK
jgi:hypothetical protein